MRTPPSPPECFLPPKIGASAPINHSWKYGGPDSLHKYKLYACGLWIELDEFPRFHFMNSLEKHGVICSTPFVSAYWHWEICTFALFNVWKRQSSTRIWILSHGHILTHICNVSGRQQVLVSWLQRLPRTNPNLIANGHVFLKGKQPWWSLYLTWPASEVGAVGAYDRGNGYYPQQIFRNVQ